MNDLEKNVEEVEEEIEENKSECDCCGELVDKEDMRKVLISYDRHEWWCLSCADDAYYSEFYDAYVTD